MYAFNGDDDLRNDVVVVVRFDRTTFDMSFLGGFLPGPAQDYFWVKKELAYNHISVYVPC